MRLPIDAKLSADGTPLRLTGAERKFVTPPLPGGMEYTYRFTAEYERNGAVVSVTRKVPVRAGGTAAIEFVDLTAAKPDPVPNSDKPVESEAVASPVSNPKLVATPAAVVPAGTPEASTPAGSPPKSGRATITVKVPPGATLFVDDRRTPSDDPVRRFTTPALPAGEEFSYRLKAEVTRNGRPEQLIQKVAFRAGEQVVVDFTSLGTGP